MNKILDYNLPILNNSDLPTYPVPDMAETLERFLEWVKPLISREEYYEVTNIVDLFIKSTDSKKIHDKISELADNKDDSWIFDYWFKTYLKSRDAFVPFINVPMVYENPLLDSLSPVEKAAAIVFGVANIYANFKKNNNGEYYIGKKRYSSDQLHGTFASINHIQRDMNTYYINNDFSKNVVVLYRNNIYSIQVINSFNHVCNIGAIYKGIKAIYKQSISPTIPNINFVTAEPDKDIAGDYLDQILKNTKNMENYQKIKDSIFVLNLDKDRPESPTEKLYSACLDSNDFNRYHGKGLEFSIAGNGAISFIVDHTFTDGGTAMYLVDEMNIFLDDMKFTDIPEIIPCEELLFSLDQEMSSNLNKSFEDYRLLMNSFTSRYIDLGNLKRLDLREKGILSGDGFFHIALQVAQMLTYGNIYNTYIAVDMRTFFRGRTESNRPVTAESIAFVEALLDPKIDILEKKILLNEALDSHYKRTVLCTRGKGVNRYLYGLEEVYNEFKDELAIKERPLLFDSLAYKSINHNKISATSFSNQFLKYSYFPPVVPGGLGIYYSISDKSFAIITSFNEDVGKMNDFIENLRQSVDKMLELVEQIK